MSAEHDRLIGSMVLVGTVAAIDEASARVQVSSDGLLTDWLAFTVPRAGPGVRDWSLPEVGEQVVLVCPYGDPSQAVVLGSIYQQAYPAPATKATVRRIEFADGAFIEYDRQGHQYALDVPSGGAITLRIGGATFKLEDGTATLTAGKFVVDAQETEFSGKVTISGDTSVKAIKSNGVNIGSDHMHGGVQPGSGPTGAPQ
ncbi:MAG: hypothetical protein GAK31_00939 [Stenotrophomonas maltophilia]|uniref:Phage baseplate assembly protein V n=1 Tax=Stenotrophomonas maltophilia TaxID=40324 RepID=A0A7V8FKD6_STEMA|nr:MAG: hypothetical protein GAK31_00939 [Stenotrophomonas maltophilia]